MKYKPEISFMYDVSKNSFYAVISSSGVVLKPEDTIGRTFYMLKHYQNRGKNTYIDTSEKWGYVFNVLFKILDDSDVNDYYCKVVYMT